MVRMTSRLRVSVRHRARIPVQRSSANAMARRAALGSAWITADTPRAASARPTRRFARGEGLLLLHRVPARSAELPERLMTVVLPEKVQEAAVIARRHVEKVHQNPVVAARSLEAALHEEANVVAGDIALDERLVDGRPERFAARNHP